MTLESIVRDFRARVCDQIGVEAEGTDRYRVLTPFHFDDGDHLVIVLRRVEDQWLMSDEGHTYMQLTYRLDERSLHEGTRQEIISNALSAFAIEDRQGELVLPVRDGRFGDALFGFVQAILKIADVTYLSRERVRSTFLEDFRALLADAVPEPRRYFGWHHPEKDPEGNYVVDCRINGRTRPTFVFALTNDNRVRDVTITLHQFERWDLEFNSLSIFENQEEIARKVLARFTDVAGKQYSSLTANRDRISRYVREEVLV